MAWALVYRQITVRRGTTRVKVVAVRVQQVPWYLRLGWRHLIGDHDVYLEDVRGEDERGAR